MISKRKATYFKILILLNSLKSCTRSTASLPCLINRWLYFQPVGGINLS